MKKLILSILIAISLIIPSQVLAARTDNLWSDFSTYIKTNSTLGYNILVNGVNKYINFNTISGSSGYGFRDNAGTMEFKDSGGAWANFSSIATTTTPGGSDTQIQFNDGGSFGGMTTTYNKTNGEITTGGKLIIKASSAATSSLIFREGILTSPVQPNSLEYNGSFYYGSNSSSVRSSFLWANTTPEQYQIPFGISAGRLTFASNFKYNSSNTTLYALTLAGADTASGNLTLQSSSNATKGKILFGNSAYDEVNNRLGIGTSTPEFKIDILDTNNTSFVNIKNTGALSTTAKLGVFNQYGGIWIGQSSPSLTNYSFLSGAGITVFNTPTGGTIYFAENNSNTRMTILPTSGNVGIGTITPSEKFAVAGSGTTMARIFDSATGGGLTMGQNNSTGALIMSHTGSDNKSTLNDVALSTNFGNTEYTINSSPATAIGSARTWTQRVSVSPTADKVIIGSGALAQLSTSQLQVKGPDTATVAARTTMTFGNGGVSAPPTLRTESNGDKWVFWDTASFRGAIGFNSYEMWFQALSNSPKSTTGFKFFSGSNRINVELLAIGTGTNINGFVFNSENIDVDARFETVDTPYMLFIDGALNRIGIDNGSPLATLDLIGTARFGDSTTNYSSFESDGTLVFKGNATVWNDANVGGLILRGGVTEPATEEWLDSNGDGTGIYTEVFDVLDGGSASIEIPHSYKEGSDIVFHVHWGINDAPSGTDYVKWQITYSITRDGQLFGSSTDIYKETAVDTQYKMMRSDFPAITGTNLKIGDQVNFHLSRVTADGDAFDGYALVNTVGFYYEVDTLGSRNISSK